MVVRKTLSIKEHHEQWLEQNNVSPSQLLQTTIDEKMGNDVWDIDKLIHEPGVTVGRHRKTDDRIVYDRFRSPQDYNVFVGGDIGSGKTYGAGYHLSQRTHFNNGIVYIDPFQNEQIQNRLGATRIHVGDDIKLNPLQIEPVSSIDQDTASLISPQTKKAMLNGILAQCWRLYGTEPKEKPVTSPNSIQTIFSEVIELAYEQVGIDLEDASTFGNNNPTFQDHLLPILEDIHNGEIRLGITHHLSESEIKAGAGYLSQVVFDPLRQGNELSQFGGKSDLELDPDPAIQLTFSDNTTPITLVMNLLFNEAYEWAKQADRNSIIAVEDSHHLLNNEPSHDAMEHILRHARHHDTSIQLHAQTLEPFSDGLIDQFSHKLVYRYERLDDSQTELLDLTPEQVQFVQHATPGTENIGYAEAILKTPERGWFPLRVIEKN